jgi:acetyltransferase-like isoleucine patch superfamily enzyme
MKSILLFIFKQVWFFKAYFQFKIYGPYGVVNTLKTAPFPMIKPILTKYGAKIGTGVVIDTGIQIHRPDLLKPFKNLTIGNDCYIGHNVIFDLTDKITIEDSVAVGASCQFWTHTGDFKQHMRTDYKEDIKSVVVKSNCIIYSATVISSGVTIHQNVRIGAGSVVLKDIDSNTFFGGNPAKKIKSI